MILERPWVLTAIVMALVLVFCVLSRVATGVRNPVSNETIKQTDIVLRSANKWAVMAKQDANVVLALMHICYAKAYVGTLRRILNDDQIEKAHQVDMRDLEQKLDKIEQDVLVKLSKQAPELMPEGESAVRTGWLG